MAATMTESINPTCSNTTWLTLSTTKVAGTYDVPRPVMISDGLVACITGTLSKYSATTGAPMSSDVTATTWTPATRAALANFIQSAPCRLHTGQSLRKTKTSLSASPGCLNSVSKAELGLLTTSWVMTVPESRPEAAGGMLPACR